MTAPSRRSLLALVGGLALFAAAAPVAAAGGPSFTGKAHFADKRVVKAPVRIQIEFHRQGEKRPFWTDAYDHKAGAAHLVVLASLPPLKLRQGESFTLRLRVSRGGRMIGRGEATVSSRGESDFTIILQPEGDSQNG